MLYCAIVLDFFGFFLLRLKSSEHIVLRKVRRVWGSNLN